MRYTIKYYEVVNWFVYNMYVIVVRLWANIMLHWTTGQHQNALIANTRRWSKPALCWASTADDGPTLVYHWINAHITSRRLPETRSKKLLEIGYSKVWCFKYYFILPHSVIFISLYGMIYDKIKKSLILSSSIWLYFKMPMRYRIKKCKCLSKKSKERKRWFTSLNLLLIPTTISHRLGRAS